MERLTDTHCHLNLNMFAEDRALVLERAQAAGVERILVPGIDLPTSRLAVELADQYPSVYAAVGIHPHDAQAWDAGSTAALRALAQHPKVMAVGEIGLDYYRDRAPREQQQAVFRMQLELAAELGLPVVLHNRDAWEDFWPTVRAWQAGLEQQASALAGRPGVLHSFDGTLEQAQQAGQAHFRIGISGPVTFKNAVERQSVAKGLPLDCLLIETDAPYLTPHPYRGRRNEPAYVARVAEKLAELHGLPQETVITATGNNAAMLLDWRPIS